MNTEINVGMTRTEMLSLLESWGIDPDETEKVSIEAPLRDPVAVQVTVFKTRDGKRYLEDNQVAKETKTVVLP